MNLMQEKRNKLIPFISLKHNKVQNDILFLISLLFISFYRYGSSVLLSQKKGGKNVHYVNRICK